jgi:hypothetical protein
MALRIDGDENAVGTTHNHVNAVAVLDWQSKLDGVSDEFKLGIPFAFLRRALTFGFYVGPSLRVTRSSIK